MLQTRNSLAAAVVASSALIAAPLALAAPAWIAPVPLDTHPSVSTTFAPQTAQDALGNAISVWQHNNAGTIEIWHAERSAGGSWTASSKLSTTSGVGSPVAVRGAIGAGLYAWEASDGGSGANIRVAQVAPDGSVTAPSTAVASEPNAVGLRGAIAPNGDVVLIWGLPSLGPTTLRASRFSVQSGSWSTPATVVIAAASGEDFGLTALPNNNFVATWTASGGVPQAAVLPTGAAAWQAPDNLDAANGVGGVRVVGHPDGRATAVWVTAAGVRAAERAASSGVWQPAATVFPDPSPALLRRPTIAAAGDAAVVVWRVDGGGIDDGTIYAARNSSGAWSAATPISAAATASDGVDPEAAGSDDGRAIAIWAQSNNVRGSVMNPAGAWQSPATISPSTGAIAPNGLSVSDDNLGNFLAGWDQFGTGGTSRRTEVAAYDGAGPGIRDISVPATAYVNVPFRVKATVTDPWSKIVGTPAWGFGGPGKAGPQRVRAFDTAASYDTFLYSKVGNVNVKLSAVDALEQVGEVTNKVTVRKPRVAVCKKVSSAKNPKKRTKFRVSTTDIKSNQRLTQEAIRKLNAVQKWLDDGIRARDICGGALPYWKLDSRLLVGTSLPSQKAIRANPRPLKIVKKSKPAGRFTTRPSQFAKNQRISAAAIRRLNALNKRLDKQLTGGDIVNGQLGRNRLVQGSAILKSAPDTTPPAKSQSKTKKPKSKKVTFKRTTGQVRTNYNIARQALVRANKVYDRARRGLVANNFKNNSITEEDFARGALPKPPAG